MTNSDPIDQSKSWDNVIVTAPIIGLSEREPGAAFALGTPA
jgi:hypothetical protein